MRRSDRPVISVAREFSVSHQTLYAWDKEIPKPHINILELAILLIRKSPKATAVSQGTEEQRLERACKRVEFLEKQVTRHALEFEEHFVQDFTDQNDL
jgi:transposase-like protein